MAHKDFNDLLEDMSARGMLLPSDRVNIRIPEARRKFSYILSMMLKRSGVENAKWLKAYDEIVEWLSDNKGLGLFLYGSCGTGKTFLSRYVIPALILSECSKRMTCYDMSQISGCIDEALSKHILVLDDVGVESVSFEYGNKRMAFAEIMDAVEKYGKLVVVTTNLDLEDLKKMYGDRTIERIKATTRRVPFTGQSFRENS